MAERPTRGGRINPTIFDKLVAGNRAAELAGDGGEPEHVRWLTGFSESEIERFNEAGLRSSVRRELVWLLNTTSLEAAVDLEDYPQVRTSVVNYGVPDLAGKSMTRKLVLQRARDIRRAVLSFEPRFAANSLTIEVSEKVERENSVTFVIQGDITSAVRAVPVKLKTDVETDTAVVTVRE